MAPKDEISGNYIRKIKQKKIIFRLNADIIALGKNYSDADLNKRFARSLGLLEEYKSAFIDIQNDPYNFILIKTGSNFKI